ncbi:uncharacterized protein N7506_001775 [Penicillium brevicompactum]|uniref:uncharacterized protein n=1 Tax=Penicillium brevicompactum TaxID=5074 RepID=UPI002541C4EC|nr:uncharacterized protein N7506_001775 [Penicillium brevicompactum]KAJ5348522.1 hypothetical protein N7506_001775 [Penicillium brevicompactum]
MKTFWAIYQNNVAHLIAVPHLPTTAKIFDDASKGSSVDPASEALLFSVCYAAVVSMNPAQLQSAQGLEYQATMRAYGRAVDQALNRADFVNSPGIFALQAAVLYLLCARVHGNTRLVWARSAMVIRLAQAQGFHRDGSKAGLSQFETEIRRRLWWHVCIMDMLCSEDEGVNMQIGPGTFDTQFPINVDGVDLTPLMRELPPGKRDLTDITLCIINCFMIDEFLSSTRPLGTVESLEDRRSRIRLHLIRDMIESQPLDTSRMTEEAECSEATIINIPANLRQFGSVHAPPTRIGRKRTVTPLMIEALCERLSEKPGLYLDEMAVFLWDEFRTLVTTSSIRRALVAKDESGCDKRVGFRRTGWSPIGVSPMQVSQLHRVQRYQILPAYAQDGIVFSRVFRGSTDATVFEDFIAQLLQHCGRWPEAKYALVMDNASFHHSERITQMCVDAGVIFVYLPPYSPDLNPIEEFFAEPKAFMKRNWNYYEVDPDQDFEVFLGGVLMWCTKREC